MFFFFISESFSRLSSARASRLLLLAAVDDDVLGANASFQHAHLRVVSSTPEQPGRFDSEVSDAFFVVVHQAVSVLLHQPLVLLFDFLQKKCQLGTIRFTLTHTRPSQF